MRTSTFLLAAGAAGLVTACGPGREETVQGRSQAAVTGTRAVEAQPAAQASALAPAPGADTLAHFRCESGELLSVRFDQAANTATILSADGDRVLPGAPVASGFLYQSPMAALRGKGDDLEYSIGRRAPSQCVAINDSLHRVLTERRAAGARWRAVGQEPGWNVEIMADDAMLAVLDYGEVRRSTPPAQRSGEGARQEWAATTESGSLRLTIERAPCSDTMSGERYWFTATLVVDDRTLRGCAQPLSG
jgi:putative lipoprotein